MKIVISGFEFTNGIKLSDMKKKSLLFMAAKDNDTHFTVPIINAWYIHDDGVRYEGYAECHFTKISESDGILSVITMLWNNAFGEPHRLPRKEYQDERYYGNRKLLQELLGDPDEENDTMFKYIRENGYIFCEQILNGPQIYQGGWIRLVFD